jgi:hypothetical protein
MIKHTHPLLPPLVLLRTMNNSGGEASRKKEDLKVIDE